MRIINSKSIRLYACFERLKSQLEFEIEKKVHIVIIWLCCWPKPGSQITFFVVFCMCVQLASISHFSQFLNFVKPNRVVKLSIGQLSISIFMFLSCYTKNPNLCVWILFAYVIGSHIAKSESSGVQIEIHVFFSFFIFPSFIQQTLLFSFVTI